MPRSKRQLDVRGMSPYCYFRSHYYGTIMQCKALTLRQKVTHTSKRIAMHASITRDILYQRKLSTAHHYCRCHCVTEFCMYSSARQMSLLHHRCKNSGRQNCQESEEIRSFGLLWHATLFENCQKKSHFQYLNVSIFGGKIQKSRSARNVLKQRLFEWFSNVLMIRGKVWKNS